jgi:hypothetical protein
MNTDDRILWRSAMVGRDHEHCCRRDGMGSPSDLLVVDDALAEPLARRLWLPPKQYVPVLASPDGTRYEAYALTSSADR